MSTVIFVLSVIGAFIWTFCYLFLDTSAAIHFIILLSFFGVLTSLYLDNKEESINKKYHSNQP